MADAALAPEDLLSAREETALELASEDEILKKTLGIGFWVCAVWLVGVVVLAVIAPMLFDDPRFAIPGPDTERFESPSREHLFGTDNLRADVFGRVAWGARTSLVVGFAAIAFGMLVGGSLGILAGFLGHGFDRVISFLFLVVLSFPALILALLVLTSISRTLPWICLTLGILAIAPIGRLSRAQTLTYAQREFVTAARSLGAKRGRIMWREILPNVLAPMAALALLGVAVAIVAEGSLAFLGLTDPNATASWGSIINQARDQNSLENGPHTAFFSILVLVLTILALNYLGDRLREYLDVRESRL